MINRVPFTRSGYRKLQLDLDNLLSIRVSAVNELQRARELGDLSENAAYRVARQKVNRIDNRIRSLKNMIKTAYVVTPKDNAAIQIGSHFTVKKDNALYSYTLVNTFESNIEKGLLSAFSPIGKSLTGKKKGDTISVPTPNGISTFFVVDIG